MINAQQDYPLSTVDTLLEHAILDLGIPPYPVVLQRFNEASRQPEPDFKHLSEIIMADVALSAGLIKTANSPFFGVRQPVRSVKNAIFILGLKTTSSAVAGIILRNAFPTLHNLERFWDSSGRIALISGWLANELALPGLVTEDAYTFGLFRDCGIPVLLRWFPAYWDVLEEANRDIERGFTQVEETRIPTNHAKVGNLLAKSWWLPEEIFLAIGHHHDLTALEADRSDLPMLSRRLIATSQIAEHIVQKGLGLSLTQEWSKLGERCLKLLELNDESLYVLETEAAQIMAETN